jgi:hypothetical protein
MNRHPSTRVADSTVRGDRNGRTPSAIVNAGRAAAGRPSRNAGDADWRQRASDTRLRVAAIEVQAIEVEALLRLERLLHHLAAIAAFLLLRSLRPAWRVRDDQQSGAADEPESS